MKSATDGPSTIDAGADGSHLDAFVMPDLDDEGPDPDGPIPLGEDGQPIDAVDNDPQLISKDVFFSLLFRLPFDLPGKMDKRLKPLAITPDEEEGARAASDSVYELIKIYYPAILDPDNEIFMHFFVAGSFIVGKIGVLVSIVRAERAVNVTPAKPAEKTEAVAAKTVQEPEPSPQGVPGHTMVNGMWIKDA